MNKIDEVSLFTCPKCNGIKKVEISNVTSKGYEKTEIVCSKCQGTGVLDWVEFVLGKKKTSFS